MLNVHPSTVYRAVGRGFLIPDEVSPSRRLWFSERAVAEYHQHGIHEVASRRRRESRLPDLHAGALTLADELDLDALPRTIADVARDLIGCTYSAFRALDHEGSPWASVTSGPGTGRRAVAAELLHACESAGPPSRLGRAIRAPYTGPQLPPNGQSSGGPRRRCLLGVPVTLGSRLLGDLYVANRWGSDGAAGFTDEDEWLLGLLASSAAQALETARLHREARLGWEAAEEERRRLGGILDALPEIVVVYSAPDGRIRSVNPAGERALGGGLRVGEHRRPGLVLGPTGEVCPEAETPFGRVLYGDDRYVQEELLLRHPDGSITPILASAAPIRDVHGVITDVVTIWQDITRLKEAEQLREQFFSLVTHELRTPLASIKGIVSGLLQAGLEWDESQRRGFLQTVDVEVDRLSRLVSNLLGVSRLEVGLMEPERDHFAPADLVSAVSQRLAGVVAEHPLQLEVPGDLPYVYADYAQIGQVLMNLIGNASLCSPAGAIIEVWAEVNEPTSELTIHVRDHGTGIHPEDLPHVFDRFYRGRHAAGNAGGGSGLGLAICKGIVEVHGERIWVESELGHGATFSFTLPVSDGG